MSDVPIVVFQEPTLGYRHNGKRKPEKTVNPANKDPSIKKLKTEFAKFTAQTVKEKKNYRFFITI